MTKCTSMWGHKYEGRYSSEIPRNITEMSNATVYHLEALRTKTYERDICVRCGHVIEKANA